MADPITREVVDAVRIAADPAALDSATWPVDTTPVRIAADEILLLDAVDAAAPEAHAIVFPDTGWVRFVLGAADGAQLIAHAATWPAPIRGLAQGAVAGIAAKVIVGAERWWVIVPGAFADEFEARMTEVLT